MICVHYLGNDGESGLLLCLKQHLNAVCLESLEIVRRGARLERAAAKHGSSRRLYRLCYLSDLLHALNRAGACDKSEYVAANRGISYLDYGVVGVELSVCTLERLTDALDAVNYIEAFKKICVYLAGISYKTDDGVLTTL